MEGVGCGEEYASRVLVSIESLREECEEFLEMNNTNAGTTLVDAIMNSVDWEELLSDLRDYYKDDDSDETDESDEEPSQQQNPITDLSGDPSIESYNIDTTIVKGIICRACHSELPPMTMAEHLSGKGCHCNDMD